MIGLMYLGAAALYFTVMFFVVRWAWHKGRCDGGSRIKASGFATLGFLAVYIPVFWNWIPTLLAHRHYCQIESGFFGHVEPEKWFAENRDGIEFANKLPERVREATSPEVILPDGFARRTYFNGLLANDSKSEKISIPFVDLHRLTWRTADARTGALLATSVDFQTNVNEPLRFWMRNTSCVARAPVLVGQEVVDMLPLDKFFTHARALKGEKK